MDEYQKQALTFCKPKVQGSIEYSAIGLAGECGEYAEVVKKHLFHGKDLTQARLESLLELGDCLWMLAQAADAWGFMLSEVAEANLVKLKERHSRG